MDYFSHADRWALNGTDARWFLGVEHDGEQVETIL
jgi:hypothetical protein